MTFLNKSTLILILLVLTSCAKNDDNGSSNIISETDFNLVTGIDIRSDEFMQPMVLGNPNTFTGNLFVAYPNPTTNYLTLRTDAIIESAWITPATAQKIYQNTNFTALLSENTHSQASVTNTAIIEVLNINSDNNTIDLRSLDPGYYKVFIKINGNLYWDNIHVFENGYQIEDLVDYWE